MSRVREAPSPPDGYRELSTEELRELLQDDAKMELIIRSNDKVQELQGGREALRVLNRGLAELSLAQRPRLDAGKLQLSHKYQELATIAATCSAKGGRLGGRGHRGALTRLQEEVSRAEEESEELLQSFMEGALALDDFLDSFQRSRRTYHIRRAQAEKLQELTRAGPPAQATPPQDKPDSSHPEPPRPNGLLPQGPLRVFQVRYGLTPAILVPRHPLSPTGHAPPPTGHAPPPPPLPPAPLPPPTVGLRLIGQLPGGWASGRPVRLYRPSPAHTEPPCR